ncbi:hypothetical protein [Heyndrickxia sp. FSL W8-0423]|uniref:hypothetical protein n=1 Tax=Heyndrickxia sp. FSL W8-0423 TaxID=2921601 RepID=UPI0030FBCA53
MLPVQFKIDNLKRLFCKLIEILESNNTGEIDYQISNVKYIIQLLNKTIKDGYIDSDNVINEIKSIHKKLYPPRGGLSDFFIWRSDFDERVKANELFEEISDELWKILQQEKN